jgi:hypothetical protein
MTIDPVFSRNPKEAEELQAKRVDIIGLGSVGSALSLMAARAGVGRLTLVDPEVLAIENIGRHMLSRPDVGRPKAKAVKQAIKLINPAAEVAAVVDDVRTISPKALFRKHRPDLFIGAADSFACHSYLNGLSLAEQIPALYIGCWGEASIGEILYVIPGRTACFECYAGFRRDAMPPAPTDPRKYTNPNFDPSRLPAQAGLWPNILVICGIAFQLALALLVPESDPAKHLIDAEHTLFLVNVSGYDASLQSLAVTFGQVKKGCPVCNESKLQELGADLAEQGPVM